MTESDAIANLRSEDPATVLDALYELCDQSLLAPFSDRELATRLVRSEDSLVRERAIFLFGIKMKIKELCSEFERQISTGEIHHPPVLSALILGMIASECEVDRSTVRAGLLRTISTREIMEEIGTVVVGFVLYVYGIIERDGIKRFLVRQGAPSEEELQQVRELLDGS